MLVSVFAPLFPSPCCSHSNFCVPLCSTLYGQISREDSLQYAETVFILCRDRDRTCSHANGSATCSSTRFRPGALSLRCTTCQPAVFLGKWRRGGRRSDNNGTNETCHFSPSTSFHFPPFLPLSSGPLSIQTVYLGQASSFMCTTPRQSGWTERRGESR